MKTLGTSEEDNDERWAVAETLPKNLIVDRASEAPALIVDRASEAPALSMLCARRVTRWKYPHLRLGCDSEVVLLSCTK
jgi:hypothetical protein